LEKGDKPRRGGENVYGDETSLNGSLNLFNDEVAAVNEEVKVLLTELRELLESLFMGGDRIVVGDNLKPVNGEDL
jgi:hypothetical protein